jgi:hypothetical protein
MGQLTPQTPRSHTCPAAQALPHAPQFARSLWASTQVTAPPSSPPQRRRFAGHSTPHRPAAQVCPAAQALPHAPQLARSLCTSAQVFPQSVYDDGQLCAHAPFAQTLPGGQALPHAPQWATLRCGSTHCPPQTRSPAMQVTSAGVIPASTAPTTDVGLLQAVSPARLSPNTRQDQDVIFMCAFLVRRGTATPPEDPPTTPGRATRATRDGRRRGDG